MLGQLLISGIAQGALYALVALAMTVVYRATTVVNFGQGDFVMAGAFVVYVMVVLAGAPFWLAGALAIALLAAFGWATYQGLIRPILAGPHLALAMMAVAVGYALRGLARLWWGREVLPFPKVLPDASFLVGPVIISASDLVVTGGVVVTVLALALIFYATPLGKTAQAVFQSERGAALVGINVAAFQGTMWAVAAGMGAIAGILIAPITLLYPDLAAATLIRGFAAMTLGGFGSFLGAAVGGLLLGIGELLVGGYLSSRLIDITAYVIIILVLLIRPSGLFGSQATVRVQPMSRLWLLPLALLAVPLATNDYTQYMINLTLVYVLVGVGFNVVIGNLGQLAFANAAFYGIGAYAAAILLYHYKVPLLLAIAAGGIAGGAAGALVALPVLRGIRSFYLAILTLAFGELMRWVYINADAWTLGSMGMHVPRPVLFGIVLASEKQKFYLFLVIVTLLVAATANLLRSKVGRAFTAIRDNELAAAAMGIPTARYMIVAFAWSGLVVGIAGALYAVLVRQVSPEAFNLLELILHFGIVVIGGLANLAGAVLGAMVLTLAPEFLRDLPGYEELLIACGMILILLIRPGGLITLFDRATAVFRERYHRA